MSINLSPMKAKASIPHFLATFIVLLSGILSLPTAFANSFSNHLPTSAYISDHLHMGESAIFITNGDTELPAEESNGELPLGDSEKEEESKEKEKDGDEDESSNGFHHRYGNSYVAHATSIGDIASQISATKKQIPLYVLFHSWKESTSVI